MSELRTDTITASDGTSPVTLTKQSAAKVWVNFNQTGTQAIRDSFNTASLTDNGTGLSTVNFTTSLSNADYSVQNTKGEAGYRGFHSVKSLATGSCGLDSRNDGGSEADAAIQLLTIHGDLA